jgi:CMP-N-acetylneuraminic acid synthetase
MERHIVIIPARSGSKSIKDKNLLKLKDKTLVRHALECAYNSKMFDKIVVTSDYRKHLLTMDDLPNTAMCKVEFLHRPEELATDDAKMIDVVDHALYHTVGSFQWVWLLQPTSPFRTINDIKSIMKIIKENDVNSVISYRPAKDHPHRMYTISVDNMAYKYKKETSFENKEELSKDIFVRSGNFYVTRVNLLKKNKTFENPSVYAYIMGNIDPKKATWADMQKSHKLGCNIDSEEDYVAAKDYIFKGYVRI